MPVLLGQWVVCQSGYYQRTGEHSEENRLGLTALLPDKVTFASTGRSHRLNPRAHWEMSPHDVVFGKCT